MNRWLLRDLAPIPAARKRCYRLEDLVVDPGLQTDFFRFLDIEPRPDLLRRFETPHNVNVPRDFPLMDDQRQALFGEAGDIMKHFGYDAREEYRVDYGRGKNAVRVA